MARRVVGVVMGSYFPSFSSTPWRGPPILPSWAKARRPVARWPVAPVQGDVIRVLGESFDEILEAARRGSDPAWDALYRDLAPLVHGYLRSRGAREPEDVTGEVFLQVARDLRGFSGDEASFRSWVLAVAHPACWTSRATMAAGRPTPLPMGSSGTWPPPATSSRRPCSPLRPSA